MRGAHAPGLPWAVLPPGAATLGCSPIRPPPGTSGWVTRRGEADGQFITRAEIEALIAEGVSYVQLDNPGYGKYLGSHAPERAGGPGAQAAFELMVDTDRAAVQGVQRPEGVTVGLHVCRGNQSSMWLGEGDYQPIAERLFTTVPVNRFLLEYDDDRAGGFEPLAYMPAGKTVVLGLVSSKTPVLETAGALRQRIDEAAKFIDLDYLALSPQCGFASIAQGGTSSARPTIADTARATWGDEYSCQARRRHGPVA